MPNNINNPIQLIFIKQMLMKWIQNNNNTHKVNKLQNTLQQLMSYMFFSFHFYSIINSQ